MRERKVQYQRGGRFGGGLFAVEPIMKGEIVAEFDGEVFLWRHSADEIPNQPPLWRRDHSIQFGPGLSRDSKGLARCANHCCEPNCGIQSLFKIVAMRNLPAGTEITWDYDMAEDSDWSMMCMCGKPTCRGVIAGYRHLPPHKRREYAGYISGWLLDLPRPYVGPAPKPMIVSMPAPLSGVPAGVLAG